MFNRILVPLDGSPLAEQALGQAGLIARACGPSIDLFLAHEPVPFEDIRRGPWGAAEQSAAARYLEAIGKDLSARAGVTVTHSVQEGKPAHVICERAAAVGADLIVMTSHGRSGLSRAWIGSVADGVMRHAKTPVLILRALEGPHAHRGEGHQLFKHVLLPLDGTSREIMPVAIALAKCCNARVTLLRVVQPVPMISLDVGIPYTAVGAAPDDPGMKEIADAARQELAGSAARLHDATGLETASHVVVDSAVATAILAFARANAVDVIAMASHTGAVSRLLLGSVSDKVARGAEVPVLLYKPA